MTDDDGYDDKVMLNVDGDDDCASIADGEDDVVSEGGVFGHDGGHDFDDGDDDEMVVM